MGLSTRWDHIVISRFGQSLPGDIEVMLKRSRLKCTATVLVSFLDEASKRLGRRLSRSFRDLSVQMQMWRLQAGL